MDSQNNKEEPKLFTFTVPGKPQGKTRARTFYNSRSDKMSSVTPEKTVLYENLIKTCFQQKYGQKRFSDDTQIIKLSVTKAYKEEAYLSVTLMRFDT